MSNKFNNNALNEYSRQYARRIAADFFSSHSVISGRQILNLTPIGQINLFVVSSLSEKWKADAEKFRSPYLDFTHPEVEEALRGFMNVVSQHISVRREHLEPLLADATRRTITMLFDPRGYFDEVIRNQPDFSLTADAVRQLTRYTQINKFVPAALEQRMNGKPFLYVNQALTHLDEILSQRGHELEKHDKYVAMLSEKVPIDLSTLLRTHMADNFHTQSTRSFFDSELDEVAPREVTPRKEQEPTPEPPRDAEVRPQKEATLPSAESKPLNGNGAGIKAEDVPSGGAHFLDNNHHPEPVAPVSQPSPMPTGAISQASSGTATAGPVAPATATINDQLRESNTTPPTLGETFHRAPIESISKSISLNQKFRFINQLFNGDTGAYNQAIEELDKVSSYGQALDLLSYQYASQYMWNMDSEEVNELVDILKRRFS